MRIMKLTETVKNEKVLCFVGGVLAATCGVKALKSEKKPERLVYRAWLSALSFTTMRRQPLRT